MSFVLQCTPCSQEEFNAGAATIVTTTSRNGVASLHCNPVGSGVSYRGIPGSAYIPDGNGNIINGGGTGYWRGYLYIASLPATGGEIIMSWVAGGGVRQAELRLTASGQLATYDATPSLLNTGSTALSTGVWYRIECKITWSATGVFDVRLDGAAEISSGAISLSTAATRRLDIGKPLDRSGQGYDIYWSDVLVSNAAYPGAGQGAYARATGAGGYSGWTTGTGATYAEVDEIVIDGDTTYIGTSSIADHTFAHQSFATIGGSGTINVVKVITISRDEAGTSAVAARLRSGTVDTDTATRNIAASYNAQALYADIDPATGTAWTSSGFDGCEIGVSNTTAVAVRCTAIRISVDFTPAGGTTKTINDTGTGSDSVAGIAVALGLADSGTGADSLPGTAAALALADSGAGNDAAPAIIALLQITDTGGGADLVSALSALLQIADSGAAADTLNLAAELQITDIGSGADSVGIAVTLTLTDSGAGADALNVITEILKSIADSGSGFDTLGGVAVQASVSDSGVGADATAIAVILSVTDSATSTESVLAGVLVALADNGAAADAIAINVHAAVMDSGSGADALGGIAAALQVIDMAGGVDVVVTFSNSQRVAKIQFTLNGRSMTMTLSGRNAQITPLAGRDVKFTLH